MICWLLSCLVLILFKYLWTQLWRIINGRSRLDIWLISKIGQILLLIRNMSFQKRSIGNWLISFFIWSMINLVSRPYFSLFTLGVIFIFLKIITLWNSYFFLLLYHKLSSFLILIESLTIICVTGWLTIRYLLTVVIYLLNRWWLMWWRLVAVW